MNITQELSQEHQLILSVIASVLNECDAIENGKDIDHGYFQSVVHFIKNYADGFHHVKEEDILFQTMEQNSHHMHCNPIPVMLREHDEGRQYVKGMQQALTANNTSDLLDNARGYCFLLQQHIYKEDHVLYPMAEEALNDQHKQQVEHAYQQVNISDYFETPIETFVEKLTDR